MKYCLLNIIKITMDNSILTKCKILISNSDKIIETSIKGDIIINFFETRLIPNRLYKSTILNQDKNM